MYNINQHRSRHCAGGKMEIKFNTEKLFKKLVDYDHLTAMHSRRVAAIAKEFMRDINLDNKEDIYEAALLHDIGKLFIPREILLKPGPLTPLEKELMDHHAFYGYQELLRLKFPKEVCCMVLLHHGENTITDIFKKYSNILDTSSIRKGAEIISCCDIYDAITNDRPYRTAMSKETALTVLSGSAFIPRHIKHKFEELSLSYAI